VKPAEQGTKKVKRWLFIDKLWNYEFYF
jgi:hypothetical protein